MDCIWYLGGDDVYSDRLKVLSRAYNTAGKNNKVYTKALEESELQQQQLAFLEGLQEQLKTFDLEVTRKESEWREAVLSVLETEIVSDLAYVFPTDGYNVKLSPRILRGKIHIEAQASSTFTGEMPGRISGTQGRIFQQVVSFAGLIGVMDLLGIHTVYVDEAFSGSSLRNIKKLTKLLEHLEERGMNLILIAQNTSMADGLSANRLYLRRSLDNQTTVTREVLITDGV